MVDNRLLLWLITGGGVGRVGRVGTEQEHVVNIVCSAI